MKTSGRDRPVTGRTLSLAITELDVYTLSHRECGQFRPCVHENFEFFKIFMNIGTKLSTLSMGQSIVTCIVLFFMGTMLSRRKSKKLFVLVV